MKQTLLLFFLLVFAVSFSGNAQDFNTDYTIELDGVDSFVEANSISNALSSSEELSMEVWIKPYNLSKKMFILTFHEKDVYVIRNIMLLGIDHTTGRLALNYNTGSGVENDKYGTTSIPADEWTHLALTIAEDNSAVAQPCSKGSMSF